MLSGRAVKFLITISISVIILLVILISCSESFVNKATFYPKPGSSVDIARLPPSITHHFIPTDDGESISSFYVRSDSASMTFLYFHGNAGNASGRLSAAVNLAKLNANVLLVEYRGYGLSTGSPSEEGIYIDGKAAIKFLTKDLGIDPASVFLYGRSLGSAVAVEVANDLPFAGLILITPIASGKEVAENAGYGPLVSLIGNPFNNLEKIKTVNLPILIIHGDRDKVLPIEMGKALNGAAKNRSELIIIPGAGHNNIEMIDRNAYYGHINKFCNAVLGKYPTG